MILARLAFFRAAIGAAALCFLASGSALAGQAVSLRSDLMDEDGRVTLGDLFDGAGAASGVVVASGSAASDLVLDAGHVQLLARLHGLDWDNASGIRRLIVQPGSGVQASGPNALTVRAERSVDVLNYAHDLNTGDIVRGEDLVWGKAVGAPPDAPHDPDAVIGKAARRPLRAGAAASQRDVAAPMVIKKDDMVAVAFYAEGMTLSLQAKAMETAAVGQPFSVMNLDSKKLLQAVATGPGQAVVGPQAEQLKAAARFDPSLFATLR